jgi:hypothetical protein
MQHCFSLIIKQYPLAYQLRKPYVNRLNIGIKLLEEESQVHVTEVWSEGAALAQCTG